MTGEVRNFGPPTNSCAHAHTYSARPVFVNVFANQDEAREIVLSLLVDDGAQGRENRVGE